VLSCRVSVAGFARQGLDFGGAGRGLSVAADCRLVLQGARYCDEAPAHESQQLSWLALGRADADGAVAKRALLLTAQQDCFSFLDAGTSILLQGSCPAQVSRGWQEHHITSASSKPQLSTGQT